MKPIRNPRQLSLFQSSFEIGVSRAARLLCCSEDSIHRLIECGKIQAYRLHETAWWKISYDSVVAYRNKIRTEFGLASPDGENSADPADSALVR